MIKEIELNVTPFDIDKNQKLYDLKKNNYIFGYNGSGKTTISRIISNRGKYNRCKIVWEKNVPLDVRVYNRDFVQENFETSSELKGVFTLGKANIETLTKINTLKKEIENIKSKISNCDKELNGQDGKTGKIAEREALISKNKELFWNKKKSLGENISKALEGYNADKMKFMEKLLNVNDVKNIDISKEQLEEKCITIFSTTQYKEAPIDFITSDRILESENNLIFRKIIIGKENVDISAMIKKLGNDDWVRQGVSYYHSNDGMCPFCQQKTSAHFENSLKEYFDESYTKDINILNQAIHVYTENAKLLQQKIQELVDLKPKFLDIEKVSNQKLNLDSIISNNLKILSNKTKEPSKPVEIITIQNVIIELNKIINKANQDTGAFNEAIDNIKTEKENLTKQVWKFIAKDLSSDIVLFNEKKNNLDKAIEKIRSIISEQEVEKSFKEKELRELSKRLTSTVHVCEEINKMLNHFGFNSFKLDLGSNKKTYKLIRENGDDAKSTLSEGEKNFVTFLYFYHLLKGSQTEDGASNDKVVVFDDPISSLDNEVMFIVSSLIRKLTDTSNSKDSQSLELPVNVKQVFVLTHNIFFHKEVTYNYKRGSNDLLKEETFWLIRKNGIKSTAERQKCNPIKTSYELLWNEIRSETRNCATIQNTMRRILENYYVKLGNISMEKFVDYFEESCEKSICISLCSWMHSGSHSVFDDDYCTTIDETMVSKYLEVFKQIFIKSHHEAHYNMMMQI